MEPTWSPELWQYRAAVSAQRGGILGMAAWVEHPTPREWIVASKWLSAAAVPRDGSYDSEAAAWQAAYDLLVAECAKYPLAGKTYNLPVKTPTYGGAGAYWTAEQGPWSPVQERFVPYHFDRKWPEWVWYV